MAEMTLMENVFCAVFSVVGTLLMFWWMSWSSKRRITRDLQKHGCRWNSYEELMADRKRFEGKHREPHTLPERR